MKTRFFAFGCSLTNHNWPTWADVVALNFDEYYNLARGGAANNFILDKFLDTDIRYNYNPDTDFVAVMTTGINRFSWVTRNQDWYTNGDMQHILEQPENPSYPMIKHFAKDMWSIAWATHNLWITVRTIKTTLERRGIRHTIIKGIDFDIPEMYGINHPIDNMIKEASSMISHPLALQTYVEDINAPHAEFKVEGIIDGHPHPKHHYDYAKIVLPEFVNEQSTEKFNYLSEGFYDGSLRKFKANYDKKLRDTGIVKW